MNYRKKSATAIALMLTLALLLGGCAAVYPTLGQDSEGTDESNAPSLEAARLTILPSTEQLLSGYSSFYELDMSVDEYVHTLLLQTDTVIKDLKLFDVGLSSQGDELSIYENGSLYTIEEFTPDKPLLINMSFPGSTPAKGLCYTDTDGTTRYFHIAISGDDGTIMLVEFENSEPVISAHFMPETSPLNLSIATDSSIPLSFSRNELYFVVSPNVTGNFTEAWNADTWVKSTLEEVAMDSKHIRIGNIYNSDGTGPIDILVDANQLLVIIDCGELSRTYEISQEVAQTILEQFAKFQRLSK